MSFYPLTDGPRFVAALQIGDEDAYKDFFQADSKSEVDKMAQEVCSREKRKTIVFERGNTIVSRFQPPAIDDPSEEVQIREKKIKRKS